MYFWVNDKGNLKKVVAFPDSEFCYIDSDNFKELVELSTEDRLELCARMNSSSFILVYDKSEDTMSVVQQRSLKTSTLTNITNKSKWEDFMIDIR